ncbi:Protein IFH1 [[Candida] zeylanoides]
MSKTPRKHVGMGGKSFPRRFSLAESDSDSDSSLTAVSEPEAPVRASAGGSGGDRGGAGAGGAGTGAGRKKLPRKTVEWAAAASDSSSDSDADEVGIDELYRMLGNGGSAIADSGDDSDSASADEDESSSDDSDVDFVQLQAQRKAQARARKGVKGVAGKRAAKAVKGARRRSSVARARFGRRKSEAALPDIKFEFEFGDVEGAAGGADAADAAGAAGAAVPSPAEDIGEEVGEDTGVEVSGEGETGAGAGAGLDASDASGVAAGFEFAFPPVPHFREEDLSDDDFEIDDNELLATLHADSDDFGLEAAAAYEEEEDPFLKEEERFLVNEFEHHGFDNEDRNSMMDTFNQIHNPDEGVVQYESSSDDSDGDGAELEMASFDGGAADGTIVRASGLAGRRRKRGVSHSDEEDDSYLWNYFFSGESSASEGEAEAADAREARSSSDSEEEVIVEELFKAMEREDKRRRRTVASPGFVEYDSGDSTDEDLSVPHSANRGQKAKEVLSSRTADYRPPILGTWVAVDSKPFGIIDGLSTRVLEGAVPRRAVGGGGGGGGGGGVEGSSGGVEGSAGDSGAGAAGLAGAAGDVGISGGAAGTVAAAPAAAAAPGVRADDALGLDELLNVSELDEDENDVRIWKDFNTQKRRVPLGAFRNKSILHQPLVLPRYDEEHERHARRKSVRERRSSGSKHKRRRASIIEAVQEGYRPTKLGLFSENALADVEEVLGDDHEFMAMIKGL